MPICGKCGTHFGCKSEYAEHQNTCGKQADIVTISDNAVDVVGVVISEANPREEVKPKVKLRVKRQKKADE